MIGHQITTTDGRVIFTPWQCEFCQLDTGGKHSPGCPNIPKIKEFEPDPVEDYDDFEEPR